MTMTEIMHRKHAAPLSDLFDWLEHSLPALDRRRDGIANMVRVEDRLEKDKYTVRAELPGIDPDKDVELTVSDGILTIAAERREENADKDRTEFRYGSFVRRVALPKGANEEGLQASYKDGILEIVVPLADDATKTRRIPVSRAQSG
jgi:HSP20 family molecular chaperone IbpA